MKRLDKINFALGISTLVLGVGFPSEAGAQGPPQFGCYDSSIGCTWAGLNGNCLYNKSNNACECRGEYPFGGGTWSQGSGDCVIPKEG